MGRKDQWKNLKTNGERRKSKAETNHLLQYKYEQYLPQDREAPTESFSSFNHNPLKQIKSACDIEENWRKESSASSIKDEIKNKPKLNEDYDPSFSYLHNQSEKLKLNSLSWFCLDTICRNFNKFNMEALIHLLDLLPPKYSSQLSLIICLNDSSSPSTIFLNRFYSTLVSKIDCLYLPSTFGNDIMLKIYSQVETNNIGAHSGNHIPDSWEDFDESTISAVISCKNKFDNLNVLHLFKSTLSLSLVANIMGYHMPCLSRLYLYGVNFEIATSKVVMDTDEIGCRVLSALISPPMHDNNSSNSQFSSITEEYRYYKKYFKNLNYIELNYCSWCTAKSLRFFAVTLREEREQHARLNEEILPSLRKIVVRGFTIKKKRTTIFANNSSAFSDDLEFGSLMSKFQSLCGVELSLKK